MKSQKDLQKTLNSKLGKIRSGAQAVVESLLGEDVDTVFGYPGGAIMPVYDALFDYRDQLKHYLTRHEQGAIHAAQGYARTKGKPGVCFATSGPGATNLITGLADALIDSTPLVCITGQVPSNLLGTDGFQETDVIGISMPVTKWNFQVTRTEEIPEAIAKAFYIAKSGRPGPVLVDITKDAQIGFLDFVYKKKDRIRSYNPVPTLDPVALKAAAALINTAKKPFLLVGQGVLLAYAQKELKAFVEKTGIPVASTLLGLSAIPFEHENYVGMLGMHGNYGPNIKTNECDVLIAVGMRFDDRVTADLSAYAKQAKVIHLEIDPSEVDKNVQTDVAVIGDAREALVELHELVNCGSHDGWIEEFKACDQKEFDTVVSKEQYPEEGPIRMAEVVRHLSEKTQGEAIIVTDVGQHQMITSRYYRFKNSHSNITSGGLGTMGFALPAAIGAKIASPEKEVIVVIGDGGFQMTIQELGTIMQFDVAVKILVLNNEFLGMVRQWQELFFDRRYSSTEMENPDFVAVAKGFSIQAESVTNRIELPAALDRMLASPKSYFMEVKVVKEENVFPMVPSGASISQIRLK